MMIAAPTAVPPPATRYPGVGPRSGAWIIDNIVGLFVLVLPLLLIFGESTTINSTGGTTRSYRLSGPNYFALWFGLTIAYYVIFEATLGATPGKLLLGLRVRRVTGERCTLTAALVRNVLRVVDGFPYVIPYLVGAIAIWTDGGVPPNRRRIGDRAAGTVVTYR